MTGFVLAPISTATQTLASELSERRFRHEEHGARILGELPDGEWEPLAPPQPKNALRMSPNLMWDAAHQRLLMSAGRHIDKAARDTWEWTKANGWRELKTKGKPLPRNYGKCAWARGLGVASSGITGKKDAPVSEVEEFDGTQWSAFPAAFESGTPAYVLGIFGDEASGAVFGFFTFADGHAELCAYSGGGRWAGGVPVAATPELLEAWQTEYGFDGKRRRLLAENSETIFAVDLGDWLDGLPPRDASGAKVKVAKGATAATASGQAPAKPAMAPQRWLVLRGDGIGKYWFAALDGAKWTARWGKRGTGGQEKTYVFGAPEEARADYEKRVSKKLDEGYMESEVGAEVAKVSRRTSFPFAATKGKPKGGNAIRGTAPITAPPCRACGKPMAFLAVFGADDERLPLPGGATALALFLCETGGKCATWESESGANAAVLLTQPLAPSSTGSAIAVGKANAELDPAESDDETAEDFGAKLGGYPQWVQDDETPECATCKAPMRFALQLDEESVTANFGDVGMAYVFTCPHQARFLWQSG